LKNISSLLSIGGIPI